MEDRGAFGLGKTLELVKVIRFINPTERINPIRPALNIEINFRQIMPQSYTKEFPHLSDKVYQQDILCLSCKSCNISLSYSFPCKELKGRIKG